MAWYKNGTVTVTNGSPLVNGANTDFVANVQIGHAFVAPDGRNYEIAAVIAAGQLQLASPYLGASAAGAAYAIQPTSSLTRDLTNQVATLIGSFAGVRDGIGTGLMSDGSAAAPGLRFSADQDTGIRRYNADALSLVTGGLDRLVASANGIGVGAAPDGKSAFLIQGIDQTTAALTDAGAHGASLFLRANGTTTGDGGALLFGTTFNNATPFAAIKALTLDGSANTTGDLAISTRAATSDTALTERMRLSAGGALGIGTTSPKAQLHVRGAGQASYGIADGSPTGGMLYLQDANGTALSGGGLLLGTAANNGTPFAFIRGYLVDGAGNTQGGMIFGTRGATSDTSITPRWTINPGGHYAPITDNAVDIGTAGSRVRNIFAASNTITPSDARLKQQIGELPDEWLDAWGEVRHVRFKFDEAVAEKGDDARWHLGFIAQEIQAAFQAKGIDASKIGLLCHDSWNDEAEPEYEMVTRSVNQPRCVSSSLVGPNGEPLSSWVDNMVDVTESVPTGNMIITRPAGDRWGLRYEQCAVIDAAWQRRELLARRAEIVTLQAQIAVLQAA